MDWITKWSTSIHQRFTWKACSSWSSGWIIMIIRFAWTRTNPNRPRLRHPHESHSNYSFAIRTNSRDCFLYSVETATDRKEPFLILRLHTSSLAILYTVASVRPFPVLQYSSIESNASNPFSIRLIHLSISSILSTFDGRLEAAIRSSGRVLARFPQPNSCKNSWTPRLILSMTVQLKPTILPLLPTQAYCSQVNSNQASHRFEQDSK